MLEINPGTAFSIMQGTHPIIAYEFHDRAGDVLGLTGMTIKVAAKLDINDPDSEILFDLTAVVSAVTGVITIDWESATGLAGSFPAEIRRWNSGVSTDSLPADAYECSVNVSEAVVRIEP